MNSTINPKALPVNPEARISLRLLSRNSFHEEDGDEEEEEEHGDEEIENENSDNTPIVESKTDHLNHSISTPAFTSPSPSSSCHGRGRGSRPWSIVSL